MAAEREARAAYEIDQAERLREETFQLDLRRDVTSYERIRRGREPVWACLEWGEDGHNYSDCKECQNRLYQFMYTEGDEEEMDDREDADEYAESEYLT